MKNIYIYILAVSSLLALLIANTAAAGTYLNWCGSEWWVRSGTGNPGSNNWNSSENSVWVDENENLHLTIQKVGDTWYSTGVDAGSDNYTYGVYTWNVSSSILNLDPNVVVSMFFLHNDSEINIDAAQWGWIYSDRLNYGVAPNAYQSAISYDSPYQNATNVTYRFDWEPTYVHFTTNLADGTVIYDWNCTDQTSIPHESGGDILIQMWLMNNLAPINGQNAEMVLSNFSYVPSAANTTDNTSENTTDNTSENTTDNTSENTTDNTSENTTNYLNWCGKEWWVRNVPGNPGGNNWSNSVNSVWVDENENLHLTIRKIGDTWYSTEVDTGYDEYKYGVYTWNVSSPILNLDPNIVAAMFFRHNDTNEIDIEATQWGWIYSDRLSCTVQPNSYMSAISYDSPYQKATNVTYQFDWEPTYIHFTAKLADGTVISDLNCTDQTSIPHVAGGVAMQMWLINHLAPINGQNAEMVLSNFSYIPFPENTTYNTSENTTYNTSVNTYLNWCGKDWWVRSGTGNPGGNNWSNSVNSVWVDENENLHLTIQKVGDTWYSTGVDAGSDNYTYGVYTWNVSSPILNLDPDIVASMFFLHNDSEIGIDATQWGWKYSNRLNYAVPNSYMSAISYDSLYQNVTNVTYQFDWEPTYIHFTAKLANRTVISDWKCTDPTSIPHESGGDILIQMWLMSNLAPINGHNAEMVLSNFSYVPS